MIKISVERVNKSKKGVTLKANGSITGNGEDILHEMVGALSIFDEVADGDMLTDALGKFLELKMERLTKGAKEDD